MSTRERILTIRLLDKAARHPEYAEALGIRWMADRSEPFDEDEPP